MATIETPKLKDNIEHINDLRKSWKVANAHVARLKIIDYLDNNNVVNKHNEDNHRTERVKIHVHSWEEFRDLVHDFMDEPDSVRRYSWFIVARKGVTKENSYEPQLYVEIEWGATSSRLDRANFDELNHEVEEK